jgi:hypothetical protein
MPDAESNIDPLFLWVIIPVTGSEAEADAEAEAEAECLSRTR